MNHLKQYFIGATLVALIPEVPEIVIGIQFALQNNISLRLINTTSVIHIHMYVFNEHFKYNNDD